MPKTIRQEMDRTICKAASNMNFGAKIAQTIKCRRWIRTQTAVNRVRKVLRLMRLPNASMRRLMGDMPEEAAAAMLELADDVCDAKAGDGVITK